MAECTICCVGKGVVCLVFSALAFPGTQDGYT
jgi:hypothetical protein